MAEITVAALCQPLNPEALVVVAFEPGTSRAVLTVAEAEKVLANLTQAIDTARRWQVVDDKMSRIFGLKS